MLEFKLRTHELDASPYAQKYFGHKRSVLIASIKSDLGYAEGEYAPLNIIHSHDIIQARALLECLSYEDLKELLNLEPSLEYSMLADFFAKRWPYPVNWVLSCIFFVLNLKNINTSKVLKLSGLVLGDMCEVKNYVNNNYTHIKLKIGLDMPKNIYNIKYVQDNFSHIKLRLDANKCLTYDQACGLLDNIDHKNIYYLEEFLKNIKYSRKLYDNFGINLAIDESYDEKSSWEEIAASKAKYIIIKPSRFSSVYWVLNHARKALEHNIQPILSTCFESAYSCALFSMLAERLDILDEAHGIWVEDFFKDLRPLFVQQGLVNLAHAARYVQKIT